MALLFMDGFDHGSNGASLGKWASASGNSSSNYFRTGVCSARLTSAGEMNTKTMPASGGFVVGSAIFMDVNNDGNGILAEIREDAVIHLTLGVTTGMLLTVRRGGVAGTLLATGTTVLALYNWYYIEFKGNIHDSTGSFEVRIDGTTEAALTLTGQDTKNGGTTGQWNNVRYKTTNGFQTSGLWVDDLYILDQSGAAPRNDFLGPVRVEQLLPQTDAVAAGSNAGLTPSTGTDHGALVDENPPNTSDYNGSATVGAKDTYNFPTPTYTGTVFGIQTNIYAWKTDAFTRQVAAVVRVDGADYDGANRSLITSAGLYSEIVAQKPTPTTPVEWVTADITALQVGMKVTV